MAKGVVIVSDVKVDVQEQSSGSTVEPIEQVPEDQQAAADSGEKVPWHQDKRFQDFLKEKKNLDSYKQFGSPQEIQEALGRLSYYDKVVQEMNTERGDEPKSTDQRQMEQVLAQARKELESIVPGLKHLDELKQAHDRSVQMKEKRAMGEMTKLMEDAGMEVDKKSTLQMSEVLADLIKHDEDLLAEYWDNPREAVRQAWDRIKTRFEAAAQRKAKAEVQKDKEPLTKLPKPHGPSSGTMEKGGKQEARTINEATERVKARLAALG